MSKVFRIVVLAALAAAAPAALFAATVDLSVSGVSGSPGNITLGTGDVTYFTSIFNGSGTAGTNPLLTMTLPASSTYVSASATSGGSCSQSAGVVTCNWASIPSSNTFAATVVVTPTAGGTLTLAASVASSDTDPNNANNSGSASVTCNDQIDLRVTVSGTPSNITLGTGDVTYFGAIFNASTSQGTNPVLTMTIPAASTFVSASATAGGSCSQSAGIVTCNWTTIPSSNTFGATVVVTPTAGGTATLSASVSGDQPDSNNANNSGSASVTVNDQIDLRVSGVSGSPGNITLGTGDITYFASIFNGSTSQGTNPVLTMTIPAASTYVSASVTGGGSCSQSAGTVTCNWTTIPSSNTFTATVVVTPTAGGTATLSASVTGGQPDSNNADNSGSGSVTVNSQIDLRVSGVSATPGTITLGTGNISYTAAIFNGSTSQGTNPVLTMTIPAASTYVSASTTGGGSCSQSAGIVTCNWTTIPSSNTFTATVVVTPTAGGTATLSASITGDQPDSNNANNSGSGSATVNDQIDLRVSGVNASPGNITLGTGDITYFASIFNASSSQGTNPVLTMTIPASSTYVSASVIAGGSCSQSAGIVTCSWTTIPSSNTFTATVVVTPTAGGTLTLSASIAGDQPDSNNTNNSGSASVTCNDQIELNLSALNGSPNPITFGAGNVTFTASIFNGSTSQGTNTVLSATLPSNSSYVSSSTTGTGGSCTPGTGTVTCNWPSIPASNTFSATIVVTPTIPGTLTLSASVTGTQPDPNTSNNSKSKTTTVTATSCTAIPTGAVAWYRAENNGVDSAGPNFATANGGATYATGEVGQAFALNGTSAYVSAPDNASLHVSALTVEGWFFLTGGSGTRMFVSKTAGAGLSNSFLIFIAGDGSIGAGVGDSTTTDILASATFPTTNAWHHFAYTYDGAVQAVYLDGALAASSGTAQVIGYDAHPLLLGADIDNESPVSFFPGALDEVTIYNRALSSTEIQTVFGAGTFGKCYIAASAPSISGFTPSSGNSGASVVISGANFTAVSAVRFNGTTAAFTGDSASQITATVPASATTGTISVVAGGGTGTSATAFTVITGAHWINSSGGNWNTASNWSTGSVPTASNDVIIDAPGTYTVTLDVNPAFNSLTVGGGPTGTQTLDLGVGHDLTFTNPGTIATSGALTFASGRLLGTGPLTVNGLMNWSSDSEIDTTVTIASGATLNISGSGTRQINGGTLNNSGTANWSGGNNISIYNSGVINNLAAGLFVATNDQLIYQHCCSAAQAFNNAGIFRKSVGSSVTTIDGNGFNNGGTLDVQSGTVILGSGGTSTGIFNATSGGAILVSSVYTLSTGATLTGSGNYQLAAGQLNVSAVSVAVNQLTLAGGNLNINGGASVSTTSTGVIDWNADATLSGAGALNVALGGTLNFSGSGTRYIDGGTLNNSGTINWSGGNNLSIYDSGVINNLASGLFLVTNDQLIYPHCCTAGLAFNNVGTFRKTTATGNTILQTIGFNNSGTVDIQSGTFNPHAGTSTAIFNAGAAGRFLFDSGSYTLGTGATLTGTGNFEVSGATLTIAATGVTVGHLTMDGGTVNITGTLSTTPSGVIDWSNDCVISGAGSLSVTSGATMNISGSGTRYIDGGTLNNDGTVNWSGGNNFSIYNSGVINNHASGLFNVKNDQLIYQHCCVAGQAFNNAGTFRKTITTGTTTVQSNGFTNSGTVDVQSGTLALTTGGTSTAIFNATSSGHILFNSPAYALSGAATLTGPGNFELSGGQVNVTGSAMAVDHLTMTGGTLNVTGAIGTSASGVVDWSSDAVLTGAGSMAITSGGVLNISGSGTRYIDGGTLNNAGTAHWSGGNNLSIYNSGVINNQSGALFDVTNDQLVYSHCCSAGQPFNNAGTFRKSTATGTTTFQGIGFANSGTVQPRSGVIALNGTFTSSGSPGYDFGIGSATTYGRLAFANPVTLAGALTAAPINSFVPQGGQQFQIISFPSGTATFSPKTLTFGSSPTRSFADSYSATAVTLTASGPAITAALSPNQGSDTGGTSVTITGSGFVNGGSLGVTFGGVAATAVSFVNATTITCTTPAHVAGVVDVVLTNGDGQPTTASNAFTYLGGTDVAISGSAPATAANGGNFTYTTVVTNNGPLAAASVTATITLPPNVTLNGSPTSTQGTCSGATTITCSIGAMPVSSTETQTINLTATGFGTAVLNASGAAAQSDTNSSNNATSSSVAIGGTSTLFVTTNADSGTGSLRQAILDANNASVCTAPCTIGFNLPGGQLVIGPPTSLPAVTAANVTIDATTQPGYSGAPLVTLDGSSNPSSSVGLQLSGGHDAVKGLSIVTFQGSGIAIDTAGNDTVSGNYIGLHVDGLTPGQNAGDGILVTTANNTIGGTTAAARNVISGNFGSGIVLKGTGAISNSVRGNYIGLNAAGTSNVANHADGVQLLVGASSNTIGGTIAAERNVISGNHNSGIYITGNLPTSCSGNVISGNFIGTDAAGTASIGNTTGIYLGTNVLNNTIGGLAAGAGNTIVSNATGISFDGPGDGNAILRNTITGNSGTSIDLGNDGPTANDAGDGDTGPNEFQNKPLFVDAALAGGTLTAHVDVDSASVPNTGGLRVELFKSDASGAHALAFLASQCFAGNALNGSAIIVSSAPVVIGDKLVATATSYADAACTTILDGTSELSAAATITSCTPPAATITPSGPTTFCTGGSVTLTASAGTSYQWRNFATPIIGANAQQFVATTAGSYTVTVTNAGGCSATSGPTAVTANSSVNVTISAGGPTTFCAGGSVTLTANPSGGSGTFASYQWLLNGSPIGGANATTYNATATGSYTVTVTDSAGCSGTSSAQSVTVNTPPPATINAPASTCANSTAVASIVSPVGGATYNWSVTNGAITTGQGTPSITFSVGTASPVSISVIASQNGCTANGSASVAIGAFTPTITGPASFCAGGSATLASSAATSYQWSLNGSPIGGATSQTYAATAAGNYTVTATSAAGCSGTSAPFAVSQTTPTTPTVTPTGPTTFCSGGSVTLTSSAAPSYQWLLNGNPITSAVGQAFTASASGNYSVTTTNASGCGATSSAVAVTVNPSPTATITGPSAVCAGGSATLDAGAGFASYSWSTGATTQTISVSPSSTTTYSVTVTNAGGCSASASKSVSISSGISSATILAPASVASNSTGNAASVAAAQTGSTYNWTIAGGSITSGNGTPSIVWTAGSGGTATISVTITSGSCTASGSVNVAITDSADLGLTMTAAPNPVISGGTLTITINASNDGPTAAQNVTVINTLFGVTAASASGNGWSCNVNGLSVVCTRPSLAVGPASPITITATATGSSAGDDAAIGTATSDPNVNNNSAAATVPVITQTTCNNAFPVLISPTAGASNLASSVTFTWAPTANAISYDLWIASSGGAAAIATTTQSTSATINLPSGPSTWFIAAHFPNGCPTMASAPPRDLSVAASTNCSTTAPQLTGPSPNATVNSPVTFTWTAVPQAIGYRLWLAIDGGAIQDAVTTSGATSATIPLSGSSVVWHVDAIFPGCAPTSSPSSSFTLATPAGCAAHAAPSLLAPAPNATLSSSIIDLQWTSAAGANGYRVWASINGADFAAIADTPASVTTLHTTFTSGTIAWYVEALFDGCASLAATPQSFTIPPAQSCNNSASTPLAPANNITLTNGFVEFDWTAVPNAIGYELWLSIDGGAPSLAGTTAGNSLSRTVGTGIIEWFVRSLFDRCDAIDSAHFRVTVTPPTDCSVTRPILTAPFDGAPVVLSPLDLRWSNVPGATKYIVRLAAGAEDPKVIGTTAALHLDNVTAPAGPVTWSVEALFDNCPPLRSTASTFTTAAPPPACATPAVPQPRAEGTASSNVEYVIRWTPVGPKGTAKYEFQESVDANFPTPNAFTSEASEFPFKSVNTGNAPITIYYRVRAISTCNGARSLFSLPLAVQILPSNVTDPSNANGSTPAENPQTTHYQIHLDGGPGPLAKGAIAAAAGDLFLATTNQPWLTVSPIFGTVAPGGTTLEVTAKTDGLPVGTSSGAVTVGFGSSNGGSSHRGIVPLDTKPASTTTISVSLVQPISPTSKNAPPPDALIIPAVAHADGINSKFQSDVRVTNSSAQPMKYQITFTPTGEAGITQGKQTTVDIDPGRTIALDDVLESWFGSNGATGTLEVRPLTATNASTSTSLPNGLANILTFASSRTFNTTSNGTFGQYIPAIPFAAFVGRGSDPSRSTILSLQQIAQSSAFRTNLGIVEGSGDPASVLVSVFGDDGRKLTEFTQELKGGQHIQLNSILAQKNVQVNDGRIEIKVVSPVGKVTAYASVLDNLTNDPLLVTPVAVNATAASKYVLPGVADLNNGIANWQTDVRLFNPSANIVKATLTFYSQNGGTPQSKEVSLAPNQVQTFDAALHQFFGLTNDGGALHITTTATTPLVATARTYNQTSNGTYGQFIPAVTANDAAALGTRPLQLLQIEESDRYRTNVGFAEVTGKSAKIEVTAVPSDSKVAASTQIDLAPNQFIQYPQLLKSMGLTNMYNARVTVKVISGQGRVTAYASVIDSKTNDPTFMPAQ